MLLARGAVAQSQGDAETTVTVERFQVSGNTLLDAAAVDAALAPLRGRRTLAELRRVPQVLEELYAQAGFGGVFAFLPAQTSDAGVVSIDVVEGKLQSVTVRGNLAFDERSVRAALPSLVPGATPRVRRIDAELEIANDNPARRMQLLLKPGQQQGEIAAEIAVQDRPVQQVTASVDDTGNSRTGRYRAGATYQHANLTGGSDVLTGQYQTSPQHPSKVTVLSAGYRYPLPAWLAVFDGYVAYSDVDAGSTATAAGAVGISGRGRLAGVRATRFLPRLGDVDQRLALALDRRAYGNQCQIDGLDSDACGAAGVSVTVVPAALEYTVLGNAPFGWNASVALLGNVAGSSGDKFAAARSGADRHYVALRSTASFALPVVETWLVRGRVALQWTGDALVNGEQFGLGGALSVRGYEERELIGDRGASGALELVAPELLRRDAPGAPSLRGFAFADAGTVSNHKGQPCRQTYTRCSIAGTGLGFEGQVGQLQARLSLALALRDAAQTDKHDLRAHVWAQYTF